MYFATNYRDSCDEYAFVLVMILLQVHFIVKIYSAAFNPLRLLPKHLPNVFQVISNMSIRQVP